MNYILDMPEISLELFSKLCCSSMDLTEVAAIPRNLAIFWDLSWEFRQECSELDDSGADPDRTALLITDWYICDWEHEKYNHVCIGNLDRYRNFQPQHVIDKKYYRVSWYLLRVI